ncbi:PREDICTED: uncharacterized protein LOC107068281, partial [Polistes dominula]|uniref:Uncharacterized protein LOC107068281 n=1 Tax=Polistes dominula TaxID=743375 RepID=A0ABM1IIF0_POLDO
LSYLGNWCIKTEPPITPCDKQWLGRGPMQDVTTQKHDYQWKSIKPSESIKRRDNLYLPCASISDDTTYRLSYFPVNCHLPTESYTPKRNYCKPLIPMDGCTTYRLSYWPTETQIKTDQPWKKKGEYHRPVDPMENCTTYKLSYWPHCEKPRSPFTMQDTENLLNADCCFNDDTIYQLSYFNCGGERSDAFKPQGNICLSSCPLSHDTVHKLSFLGNWSVTPEKSMTPCDRQLLGRGPMQDETTQKHDYTWRYCTPSREIRPENNLTCAPIPLECCTTHKLSYIPNDSTTLLRNNSYAPCRQYQPPNLPMESETTMRLSYQPVEPADRVPKPWSKIPSYHKPVTPLDDNTTYNLSYIPPGTLVPLPPCYTSCSTSNNCNMPPCQPCQPCQILMMILGLAIAQEQNYRNNYQEDERQNAATDGRRFSTTTPIPILHWNKQQEHDGTYKTSYETGNNIIAEESGYIKTVGEGADRTEALVQQGSYSYMSPEGQLITIHYTADETGFHASGEHIPTPPPVGEEIQKGLDLIFAGIRQQEEADAREAASKNQPQPQSQQIDRRDDYDKKFRQ